MLNNNNNFDYYTEVGIKISNLRLSVRLPKFSKKALKKDLELGEITDHYWTFCSPSANANAKMNNISVDDASDSENVYENVASAGMPSPPLPPKSSQASKRAPECVKPPYPSSTVSRRNNKNKNRVNNSTMASSSASSLAYSSTSSYSRNSTFV